VLQILIKPRSAMPSTPALKRVRTTKRMTVRISHKDGRIASRSSDTESEFRPENLLRIFNHGFHPRKTGHGFGLTAALAAKELGGSLDVHSDGPARRDLYFGISCESTSRQ